MYDIRARNSVQDRAAAGPRPHDDSYGAPRSSRPDIAPPEVELLRAIGWVLEEQRARAART
ncbi:succinoglycan biosynthesis protein exop, partial [Rhizobium leguminosarum]